jgi:hypothetical protein
VDKHSVAARFQLVLIPLDTYRTRRFAALVWGLASGLALAVSHVPMLSQPDHVLDVIRTATKSV